MLINFKILFSLFIAPFALANSNRVLLVGDSHTVGSFGDALKKEVGSNLHAYGVVGISAPWYLRDPVCGGGNCPWKLGYRTPKEVVEYGKMLPAKFPGLQSLLDDVDPKMVIVELGTNDAGNCSSSNPAEKMLAMVKMIRGKGIPCFWVGPPVYLRGSAPYGACGERYNSFVDKILNAIEGAGCKFIDSRHIRDPQKQNPECGNAENWKNPDPKVNCSIQNDIDQYHFGDRLGAVWAQGVMRQIR